MATIEIAGVDGPYDVTTATFGDDPTEAISTALVLVRGLGQGALSLVSLAMVGKWFTRRLGVAMGVFTVLLTFGIIGGYLGLKEAVGLYRSLARAC